MNGYELIKKAVADALKELSAIIAEDVNKLEARIVELEKRLAGGSQ